MARTDSPSESRGIPFPNTEYNMSPLHSPNAAASSSRTPWERAQHTERDEEPYHGTDEEDDLFDLSNIDPALRLRTTRTAHSVLAESVQIESAQERRKRRRKELLMTIKRKATISTRGSRSRTTSMVGSIGRNRSSTIGERSVTSNDFGVRSQAETTASSSRPFAVTPSPSSTAPPSGPPAKPLKQRVYDLLNGKAREKPPQRRMIYVNIPLPSNLLHKGEPIVRYVRNKVRTAKYTIITFLPKNLFEQFRRVANVYFLGLVILQLFPIFGAPNGEIGMLPLLAILGMTAIKDAIEDWRRAQQDNEVNNSATTKLGGWRNVNQPKDSRSFFERLLNLGPDPGRPSKGVKKLREAEATAGKRIVVESQKGAVEEMAPPSLPFDQDSASGHELPDYMRRAPSAASVLSKRSAGVVDWSTSGPGTAAWERTLWKKLEVGDIVLLQENEQVPADIIVLSTSNPDHVCFVETKNLDGETNLKVRRALKATCNISSEEEVEHAHFVVDSEPPHANLYSYNGVLRYSTTGDKGEETRQEAVTINELLLRGCSLRNTKWVVGLVVFTGGDTKIMINGGDTPSKRSKIERETNFNVIMNFALLMVLCLATAMLHAWYQSMTNTSAELYEPGAQDTDNIYLGAVIIFFSCLIVFQNIVPISLYITIEIVKTIQAYFIFQDVEMYYEVYDTPCVPKTWNISDDLGQIEYVFSDKTGTLTQNIMEFKKCSIQGISFGEGMTEAMVGAAKRDGQDTSTAMDDQVDHMAELTKQMIDIMKPAIPNRYLREDQLTLVSPDLATRMSDEHDPLQPHIIAFFRALAVCHTVLSDTPDDTKPYVLDYKAESPDEAALVAAARDVGFPFVNRNNERIDIEVLGRAERWVPLRVLEFNSTRKRMSVIARSPDGQIVLFCKGADSVIYERVRKDHDLEVKQSTLKDLETFANGGLRTLCIAYRNLSEEEFTIWAKEYDAASAAISDREDEIERACEKIEHSLTILGATALEDKLQEGVPDAIATLHEAGIKLWILTGDKLQTAIEIGYSCNLLTNDMEVMIISTDSLDGARAQIEAGLNKIASVLGPPPIRKKGAPIRQTTSQHTTKFAVVIDGESLRYALGPELKSLFLSLSTQCAAVICCRVSPSQKALTVRLVKEGCNAMTLAIGDGANDVAMIQEANIGVGLFGLEGSQAAMSADYAFGQFRFLVRLLLVHGRWSYVRVADMHANFFYKNVIWTISMFWFLIFNSFDATYLFEYTLLLFYNLFFTSLPVAVMGIFEQDTNARASMAFPQLYKPGILGTAYTRTRFWLYMLDGLYQSAAVFFIPFAAYGEGVTWSSNGQDTNSLYELGSTVAFAAVLAANGYVGINTRYWTILTWVIYVGSTLLIFIWMPIYSAIASPPFQGTINILFPSFNFWATTILTVFVCLVPRWIVRSFRQSYLPQDKDIVREAWVAGDLKDQLGLEHRRNKRRKRKNGKVVPVTDNAQPGHGTGSGDVTPDGSPDFGQPAGVIERFVDDERGFYRQADLNSPHRPRSLISQDGSNRDPFAYPPPSPLIRQSFSPSPSPQPKAMSAVPTPLSLQSPTSPYTTQPGVMSPTSVDAYRMTQAEINRMSYSSADLDRANTRSPPLSDHGSHGRPTPVRRTSSRRQTPTKRLSVPGEHPHRYDPHTPDMSPQRASFEVLGPEPGDEDRAYTGLGRIK